jgi:hypothetical protein
MNQKNLRRVKMTVTAQTAYHLQEMAGASGARDLGRVVDKLVREHQTTARMTPADLVDKALALHAEKYRTNDDKQKRSKYQWDFLTDPRK